MKRKLKYINLFEELSQSEMPYSKLNVDKLSIKTPKSATSVPSEFNELTTEVAGIVYIQYTNLKTIEGFNSLKKINSYLSIKNNTQLTQVTGFDKLESVNGMLYIENNPNLVTLSIPSTMIRSIDYKYRGIKFENEHYFKSPEEFVNSGVIIQDCIDKFDPVLHGDIVVEQILENIEIWGTPETQETIINYLLSKGNYWSLIPENLQHLAEENYKHLYAKEFNNTGAKSVAKVATGITYGLF